MLISDWIIEEFWVRIIFSSICSPSKESCGRLNLDAYLELSITSNEVLTFYVDDFTFSIPTESF